MKKGHIYTLSVIIDGEAFKLTGRYDTGKLINIKKPSLFCSLVGNETILSEWSSLKEYKLAAKSK